jgi:hypothetical protein
MTAASPNDVIITGSPNFNGADCKSPDWLLEVLESHRDQILSSVRALLQENVDKVVAERLKDDHLAVLRGIVVHDKVVEENQFAANEADTSQQSGSMSAALAGRAKKTPMSTVAALAKHHIDEENEEDDDDVLHNRISSALIKKEDKTLKTVEHLAGVAIVANTVSMLVQLQWYGHVAAMELGISSDDGSWPMADELFEIAEHIFNVMFLVELAVKLCLLGRRYFHEPFNWMDFLLVLMTSVQMYVFTPLGSGGAMANLTIFRLLRFMRTIRVFKAVRVMRMFTELRVLVHTFLASLRALLWSLVFLAFIIVLGALFLSFALHDTIIDPTVDRKLRMWLYNYYGSSSKAVYTLFEVTLAGCWPTYFRPLMESVSGWYVIFILIYVSVVVFALTRIISALFLKETLQIAANDQESQAQEQEKKKKVYVKKLRAIYNAADTSGDGMINEKEFGQMLKNPTVNVVLKMLDVDMHDAGELFHLLDSHGTGEITFEDFVGGVTRMKGAARSVDLIRIMSAHDKLLDHISSTSEEVKADLHQLRLEEKRMLTLLARSLPELCSYRDKMLL